MEDELEKAVTEQIEAYDFIMDIWELTTEEMVEAVEKRDPSFIEFIKRMRKPPKNDLDFLECFCFWTITILQEKYSHIWDKATDAYFHSEARKKRFENAKIKSDICSAIEQILKNSGF